MKSPAEDYESGYPGGWFGESWGAPVCTDARHLPTPIGEQCRHCEQPILDGDQGLVLPHAYLDENNEIAGGLGYLHIDCFLDDIGIHTEPRTQTP